MFKLRVFNCVKHVISLNHRKQLSTIANFAVSGKVSAFVQDTFVVIDATPAALKTTSSWQDSNEKLKYPLVWLRDNCQCSKCFHKGSSSRVLDWTTFDVNVTPINVVVCLSVFMYGFVCKTNTSCMSSSMNPMQSYKSVGATIMIRCMVWIG